MNVSSENIERKIRAEAEDLPTETLWERISLCIEADTPQPIYGMAYCKILKERSPTDERAHLGMAQCFMEMKQYDNALKEVREGKELVARLTNPASRKSFDNYLLLHYLGLVIDVRKNSKHATPFRLLVLEGLRQRSLGDHNKAQKFFMSAAKHGIFVEKEEAYFYATTLFDLTRGVIEKTLFKMDGPPMFFSDLPEYERDYIRKVRKHILDIYMPCRTKEEILKNFGMGRKKPPISKQELEKVQESLPETLTFGDLGF